MTPFEKIVRTVTADWRRNKGLSPLEDDITLPVSICEVDESVSGWPFCKPEPLEAIEPEDESWQWPDDSKLDDPRRGQAKWINR